MTEAIHVNESPVVTSVARTVGTYAGTGWLAEERRPRRRYWFEPQHHTEPVERTAQLWARPTSAEMTESMRARTGTTVFVFVPSPSCPLVPRPQHHNVRSCKIAHE